MNKVQRFAFAVVAAAMLSIAILLVVTAVANAHYVSGWSKIVSSNVNGLCGIGSFTCFRSTMKGKYISQSAGHWRQYEVEYYEIKPWLGPWGTRHCHVNKVWVEHADRIGTPIVRGPDYYCWK